MITDASVMTFCVVIFQFPRGLTGQRAEGKGLYDTRFQFPRGLTDSRDENENKAPDQLSIP
mgnify:CR=1 FL=1